LIVWDDVRMIRLAASNSISKGGCRAVSRLFLLLGLYVPGVGYP